MINSSLSVPAGIRLIIGALFALSLALLPACSSQGTPPKPAAPVTTATVMQKNMPYEIRAIGNIEANLSVIVKSQIGGILSKVHFKKGQFVKKGALLFTIDPRPLQASLMQARGALARDVAQLTNARADEKRYAELVKKGYISRQQYEQQQTSASALEATVSADRAAVEYAKVQLSYCYIHSPINGYLGDILIDEGNLVKANDDNKNLTTIRQTQPITVSFSAPEKDLAEITKYNAGKQLPIDVYIDKQDRTPEKGVLIFIDNTVDTSTGTIKLKGALNNEKGRLWPGQFVNVSLFLYTRQNAVVVPSQAVQVGQTGQYVYVVKDDMTAEMRPVVVSSANDNDSIIEKGLKPGETIVLDGQLRVTPGGKVKIKGAAGAAGAAAPASRQIDDKSGTKDKSEEMTGK
jgi:membrane fusion protein, multidrug efflux system